jgi:hypothetical protein
LAKPAKLAPVSLVAPEIYYRGAKQIIILPMDVHLFLHRFSGWSGIFPVLAIGYNFRHLDKVLKIVALFFVISFISDLILIITTALRVNNNLPVVNIFYVVNIIFFGIIYYQAFFEPILKKMVMVLSAMVFLFAIYNLIFVIKLTEYPSASNTALSVISIIFSLIYFYQLLNRQEFIHIEKQGLFWFNSAVLFYFSINIFLFMLFERLLIAHASGSFVIHDVVNIIANVLYTFGLLCKPQKASLNAH